MTRRMMVHPEVERLAENEREANFRSDTWMMRHVNHQAIADRLGVPLYVECHPLPDQIEEAAAIVAGAARGGTYVQVSLASGYRSGTPINPDTVAAARELLDR